MPRKLDAWPVDAWKRILNQSKFSPFLNALILLYPFWLVLEPNTVPNLYFLSKNSTRGKTCIVVNLFFIVHNLTEFCDKIDQNWFIPFRVHPIFVTKIDFFDENSIICCVWDEIFENRMQFWRKNSNAFRSNILSKLNIWSYIRLL